MVFDRRVLAEGMPKITGIFNLPNYSARAYVLGRKDEPKMTLGTARTQTLDVLKNVTISKDIMAFAGKDEDQFMVADAYMQNGEPVLHCFRLDFSGPWPGDAKMFHYVFMNGIYQPREDAVSSEEILMLGIEETFRRRTEHQDQYRLSSPIPMGMESLVME